MVYAVQAFFPHTMGDIDKVDEVPRPKAYRMKKDYTSLGHTTEGKEDQRRPEQGYSPLKGFLYVEYSVLSLSNWRKARRSMRTLV